ncbi:MAG: hypothetical protein JWP94_371 [Mucilaginibacter sp.]|nr:hypothetical protein [Mucilaginibacter sp.]
MQLSEQLKPYLIAFGMIILSILILYKVTSKYTCDDGANYFKDHVKFNLILTKKENPNKGREVDLYGIDLYNNEPTDFHDENGWIKENIDKFIKSDTLIKEKGKYSIIIKRTNKVITIPYECDEKRYIDK